jgi:hypothetical protein
MMTTIAKKTAFIGAGAGRVLFALFGLMPGSLLGGAMGINIAGWLFGLPLQPGLVTRVIVFASMLIGVLGVGIVMVSATSTTGWLVSKVFESGTRPRENAQKAKATQRQSIEIEKTNSFGWKEIYHEERDRKKRDEDRCNGRWFGFPRVWYHAGILLGSFGTLILLQKIMGSPVEPTLFVRAAMVIGIVVGIACAAAVSLVVGGLIGAVLGYVVSVPAAKKDRVAEKA